MGINALSFIFFKKNIAAMKIKIKNKIVKLNAFQKPTVRSVPGWSNTRTGLGQDESKAPDFGPD